MKEHFAHKTILITGAAGSVGQELVRQLLALEPAEIRAMDNNETELFHLRETYAACGRLTAYLGDVRDGRKLENLCHGVDLIFHVAAYKHVTLSEYNPFDVVQTNILGVKNVIQAALAHKVPRVIFTSSDKAVNPTNVMGTSKLMGERLMTAANIVTPNGRQVFSSVRFGNVIGSRGSVVPIFAEQIRRGQPVTVTDVHMTRFFMTLPEAARLVLEAAVLACGGEVLVTKMPVIRILDLAQAMIELLAPVYGYDPDDLEIRFIGARSGEKLYEELMSQEETGRAVELEKMFVILPAMRSFYQKIDYSYPGEVFPRGVPRAYVSSREKPMTVEQIKNYLRENGVLPEVTREVSPWPLPSRREVPPLQILPAMRASGRG
ncbi:MAG: SDR family NAD(P)-dependent oxidoreductase [Desulfobaccales bacterium]